jgi:type II secretory pathway pseudopilin PulG
MTGPPPPQYGAGPSGPAGAPMYPEPYGTTQDFPGLGYPGALPPPVQYPRRRRRTWLVVAALVLAVVVVAGVVTAAVLTGGREQKTAAGTLTEASAQAAIQNYLDALTNGDDETVARHTLCGLFDAVKEKRSDLALASLSSDAFRKQYSSAQVESIDKMVPSSPTQAQVLFTLKVTPASRSARPAQEGTEQAVAQVLAIDGEVLVCSYLPRTAGQY